jgi:ribosomal 50S subunit-recycling heat shock protein
MSQENIDAYKRAVEAVNRRDIGDRVVALGRLRARGQESGVETDVSFNQVVEFRNARVFRLWSFLDREDAPEAAGLWG